MANSIASSGPLPLECSDKFKSILSSELKAIEEIDNIEKDIQIL